MATKQYTPEEKADYKRVKRDEAQAKLHEALDELQHDEGWLRWLKMRAAFHTYSWHNTLMIAFQARDWPVAPSHITGAKTWINQFNRHPQKGTHALRIFAPVMVPLKDKNGREILDEKGKPKRFPAWYKLVPVFDVTQTEGDEFVPAEKPEIERLSGEDQMSVLIEVYTYAEQHGMKLVFDDEQETNENLRIALRQIVERQIKTMALSDKEKVIEYLGNDERALIAEAVTFIILNEYGFDTSMESVPTIWETALSCVEREDYKPRLSAVADKIDRLTYYIDREASVLEEALGL